MSYESLYAWIGGTDGPEVNRLTLSFHDRAAEKKFTQEYIEKSLPVIRLSLLFGALIYATFGILDYFVIPEILVQAWLIRYGVVTPLLAGLLIASYFQIFIQVAQLCLSLAMFSTGVSVVVMTAIAGDPGSAYYYAGLIPIVIYCCNLLPMRFIYALIVCVSLLASYQLVAFFINPISITEIVNNNFFLGTTLLMSLFAGYAHELSMRREFVHNQLLKKEKSRSEMLLHKAEEANRTKSEFLAVMSHELRTPLNAIIGFSEILSKELFGPIGHDRYKEYAGDICSSGTHLLEIINDILDLSKAEAGKLYLDEQAVDVSEVVDRALRLIAKKAEEEGVELVVSIPPRMPMIRADLRLLTQLSLNLLSNAVKFTPSGGQIFVSTGIGADGSCAIRFRDTGIGIAKEDLPRVFDPFVQVENPLSRVYEGTGLGLPLCKKIMEMHQGTLDIESEVGKGSVVSVHFPAERVEAISIVNDDARNVSAPSDDGEDVGQERRLRVVS